MFEFVGVTCCPHGHLLCSYEFSRCLRFWGTSTLDFQQDEYIAYRQALVDDLFKSVLDIDETRFNAKTKLKQINTFNKKDKWKNISDTDSRELSQHIAPLIAPIEDDELAKRFDYLVYTIEYAELTGKLASKPKSRVISTAERLSQKGNIAQVKQQEKIIRQVQTEEFWQNATIFDHERVREALRDLLKFTDNEGRSTYYSNFRDEVLEVREKAGEYTVGEYRDYRKKVDHYLKTHQDEMVIYKLRNNLHLTESNIERLEKILWEELGTREDYKRTYGENTPLLQLVSRILGLEPKAANEHFSQFLTDESLNKNQMEFVNMIVKHVIQNGYIEKEILTESPFNDYGNIIKLFGDKLDIAKKLVAEIDRLNGRLDAG